MLKVLSCIVVEHDLTYLLLATMVCVLGSLLTVRLFARVRLTEGVQKANWLFLSGFIGGSTIWTTHFVAMLGYRTGVADGFEPVLTLISLLIGIGVTSLGFFIAAASKKGALIEAGGAIVGLGICLMHYTGMAALLVEGRLEWDRSYVLASLVLAAIFGALCANRIARPLTRYCKYGAVLTLILAITAAHFTGMAALTVVPDPTAAIPPEFISDAIMTGIVTAVMVAILALGASTYAIDLQSTQDAVERYRHLSLHDPLTGLPNRAAFNEHLCGLLARPRDATARIAILSFDLDRFKEINDVHGHSAGDAVLRVVSERVSRCLKPGEFLARVGGDEFVAVTRNYDVRGDASALGQRLLGEICKPIEWAGRTFSIGSSVGIAIYPDHALQMDELVAQADVAMYRAKSTATNTICFYDPSMDQMARERNALAMEMRSGLQAGEFELFYQPQIDAVTSKVIGYEALLRWRHSRRGMVAPSEFIPVAERSGFIAELGEWVLRTACAEAATWGNPLCIAVNVAAQQLTDNKLPAIVGEILTQTGLDAKRLELEITESSLIADQQHALHVIRQLKRLGVKIAMDDYGTGYSSLSTLQTFPFDKIKIDRAFVEDVASSRQSAAIVRSTLILASSLDIPVLAEGVETEEHIDFLRREGCPQVQGFLFGKPMPRDAIDAVVNRNVKAEAPEVDAA
ncbi:EAL domain-containing protein [Rhizobiaceae bacterium n13]|uniref:EAL domain-containing protein n=1 Tax=Ferirhizobium litorale TaxID=2927786 RepID=A0AAE3QBV1_9HYPH|nr:EAL domain-containing protein [Fererhizobium litorale]MDI7860882.1 EAL domain-containing protein [Fererhizobium litorale]MDI7921030.1 EAL domain-containing protein [Fererhizobium litorale]